MPKVTQIATSVKNKPGALAQICSTLGKAGVNISALLAPEAKDRGKVRLLVDNPDKAKEALNTAKVRFSEEEVIALNLDNRPGALAEVSEKLAQSKINIRYSYATAAEGSAKATVIIAVRDVNKALSVLGE
jgi:hypothetical protein